MQGRREEEREQVQCRAGGRKIGAGVLQGRMEEERKQVQCQVEGKKRGSRCSES